MPLLLIWLQPQISTVLFLDCVNLSLHLFCLSLSLCRWSFILPFSSSPHPCPPLCPPKRGSEMEQRESSTCLLKCRPASHTQNIHIPQAHHCLRLSEGHTSRSHRTQLFRACEPHSYLAVQHLPAEKNQKSWDRPSIVPKTKESRLVVHLSRAELRNISAGCLPLISVCDAFYARSYKKERLWGEWYWQRKVK